jgi:hypothetical protein
MTILLTPSFARWGNGCKTDLDKCRWGLANAVISTLGQQETKCNRQAMSTLLRQADQFSEKAGIAGSMSALPE